MQPLNPHEQTEHAEPKGRAPYRYPGLWLGSGNRCGHRKEAPAWHRYNAPPTKNPLPHFIQDVLSKVEAYYADPKRLPTLAHLSGKVNKDGSLRDNRSEAREADCLVLKAILSHTEYASMRVGTPLASGMFIHRTMKELAAIVGMVDPETGIATSRFWRAISRLKLAGAIDVHKQFETKEDGSIKAYRAIKTVNMHFLVALGVTYEALKKFRTYCSGRLKKAELAHEEANPGANDAKIARRKLREQQREKGAKTAPLPVENDSPLVPVRDSRKAHQREYNKAQLEFATNLQGQYPGRTSAWYGAQLREHFPSLDDWIALQDIVLQEKPG